MNRNKKRTYEAEDSDEENAKYCSCRKPAKGLMVCCDSCNEWFHDKCVGITEEADLGPSWLCFVCERVETKLAALQEEVRCLKNSDSRKTLEERLHKLQKDYDAQLVQIGLNEKENEHLKETLLDFQNREKQLQLELKKQENQFLVQLELLEKENGSLKEMLTALQEKYDKVSVEDLQVKLGILQEENKKLKKVESRLVEEKKEYLKRLSDLEFKMNLKKPRNFSSGSCPIIKKRSLSLSSQTKTPKLPSKSKKYIDDDDE